MSKGSEDKVKAALETKLGVTLPELRQALGNGAEWTDAGGGHWTAPGGYVSAQGTAAVELHVDGSHAVVNRYKPATAPYPVTVTGSPLDGMTAVDSEQADQLVGATQSAIWAYLDVRLAGLR